MSRPAAVLRLCCQPANPGEFLAACGVLELAGRLNSDAQGRFVGGFFELDGIDSLDQVIGPLSETKPVELTAVGGLEVKPLIAPLAFEFGGRELILDGWMALRPERNDVIAIGNAPWNFWSGQQTSLRIWTSLTSALRQQLAQDLTLDENLFRRRLPLSGRFGFDPGAAWNALDTGFSPNEQGMDVASAPVVELLAAVGLQRFRPMVLPDRESFEYAVWTEWLPPLLGGAIASGARMPMAATRYRGRAVSRGSYSALAHSTPLP